MDDYSKYSTSKLEDIYYACKLDERFDSVRKRADRKYEQGSREWLIYVAFLCDGLDII